MFTLKIGPTKTILFKNKFDEITVAEFAANIEKENKIEAVLKEIESLENQKNEFEEVRKEISKNPKGPEDLQRSSDIQGEIDVLDAMIAEDIVKARILRVEQIAVLTQSPTKTEEVLLTTKGLDFTTLGIIVEKVNEGFGDFNKYFEEINGVKSFAFADYKRHGLFRLKRCIFHVADLGNQTVLRDAAAMIVAQQIGTFAEQFKSNDWRNFARFVAYVARPKRERYEYQPRSRWLSFIGGKRFEKMTPADRVSYYNKKLEETVEERTKVFERLPIRVAIGVYKYYFFLKKNFLKNSKVFIKKTSKRRKRPKNIIKDSASKPVSKT